mmetsp:Transcript_55053/g.153469  ORF Transcript_55053/g.153469 Transcript_55053/m.153469 type:complete len:346 (+) Transcript_55053:68-1105(+)
MPSRKNIVPTICASEADPVTFREKYESHQAVLVKGCLRYGAGARRRTRKNLKPRAGLALLRRVFAKHAPMVKQTFNLENGPEALADASKIFGRRRPPDGTWYASFVVQKRKAALSAFLNALPMKVPHFLADEASGDAGSNCQVDGTGVRHSDAVWVFVGRNTGRGPLKGRPEHTDAVEHSGTWHLQLRGAKVWTLRPSEELKRRVPSLRFAGSANVRCHVGDVLCVNTRLWWHRTYLPGGCGLSMSVARDMCFDGARNSACDMTNIEGHYAMRRISKGTILATEDEMPDMQLPRDSAPNCEVGEFSDGTAALVALRNIKRGEWFSIAPSEDEEDTPAPKSRRRRN